MTSGFLELHYPRLSYPRALVAMLREPHCAGDSEKVSKIAGDVSTLRPRTLSR